VQPLIAAVRPHPVLLRPLLPATIRRREAGLDIAWWFASELCPIQRVRTAKPVRTVRDGNVDRNVFRPELEMRPGAYGWCPAWPKEGDCSLSGRATEAIGRWFWLSRKKLAYC
jgi:hypothetical protein